VWKVESPVGSSQRLKNWHLLLPSLAFTIKGLEQGWLAQCQFNVTGWGIMFICGMVLRCAESGPVTADLTTTVVQTTLNLITHLQLMYLYIVTADN